MSFILFFLALIVAITIHEFSHAFIADRLGDPTPRAHGRLSLNPLSHLDPLGTLMLLLAHIGWGKPVPIDPYNFQNPRRDELLTALAGPAANLTLAVLLSLIYSIIPSSLPYTPVSILISINVSLAIFNLLPLPPLDGSKIFLGFFPHFTEAMSRSGYLLLALLLLLPINGTNLISQIITPIISLVLRLLLPQVLI